MEKYASIDIGTNSMRLLLAEIEGQNIIHRQKFLQTTRIGKVVDSGGRITPEGIETNLKAFDNFVNQAKNWGAKEIWAIATSAVRDAKNGRDYVDMAFQRTGVKIDIIPGKEEALLGYKGVLMGLKEKRESILIVDIGGGSTEFIIGNQETIEKSDSYNVGALRMTERYINSDPPTTEELSQLMEGITCLLEEPLKDYLSNGKQVIAIGGTATTMASLHQEMEVYDMDKVHGYEMEYRDVVRLRDLLSKLSIMERKNLKGMEPNRADILLAGITIMAKIMELLNITDLKISEYDNLEGLLYTKL